MLRELVENFVVVVVEPRNVYHRLGKGMFSWSINARQPLGLKSTNRSTNSMHKILLVDFIKITSCLHILDMSGRLWSQQGYFQTA